MFKIYYRFHDGHEWTCQTDDLPVAISLFNDVIEIKSVDIATLTDNYGHIMFNYDLYDHNNILPASRNNG